MTAARGTAGRPQRWQVATAFALVYVLWGSTYLAIRFAIETLPPFTMAATRFLVAGALLYVWTRRRGAPPPRATHWWGAIGVGGLLLMGGNGGVVWAEQRVPSGLAALMVATVPLWMVLLDGAGRGWRRPPLQVLLGVALGLLGVGVLVGPGHFAGGHAVDPVGAAVLIVASLCWTAGSLYSRRAPLPESRLLGTAMEMLGGGACLALLGAATGEWSRLHLALVSPRSLLALGYLVVFGSLVGFTAYIWLLRVSTPALVSTYAYVNPVVAVLLGWALAGESISGRTLLAAAVIVGAVMLITTHRGPARPRAVEGAPAEPAVDAATSSSDAVDEEEEETALAG